MPEEIFLSGWVCVKNLPIAAIIEMPIAAIIERRTEVFLDNGQ